MLADAPLYSDLDTVALFIEHLGYSNVPDAVDRRKSAIARYIAELTEDELANCRENWRAFAGLDAS